jgi:hypothetical protein
MAAVRLAEFLLSLTAVVGVVLVLGVVAVRSVTYMRWKLREEERAEREFAEKFGPRKQK